MDEKRQPTVQPEKWWKWRLGTKPRGDKAFRENIFETRLSVALASSPRLAPRALSGVSGMGGKRGRGGREGSRGRDRRRQSSLARSLALRAFYSSVSLLELWPLWRGDGEEKGRKLGGDPGIGA